MLFIHAQRRARATCTGIFQLVAARIRGGVRGGAIVDPAQGHPAEDHGIPALRVAFHVPPLDPKEASKATKWLSRGEEKAFFRCRFMVFEA